MASIQDCRVVAVSNGTNLIGSRLGEVIDSFEHVIRFNQARIRGFEADVGTKTTIWIHGFAGRGPLRLPGRRICVLNPHKKKKFAAGVAAVPEGAEIPEDIYDKTSRALGRYSKRKARWPTTGCMGILAMLEEFPCIALAGWFRGEDNKEVAHYWPENLDPARQQCHDFAAEGELLKDLAYSGQVVFLDSPEDMKLAETE